MEEICVGCSSSVVLQHYLKNPTTGYLEPGDMYCEPCWCNYVRCTERGRRMFALPSEIANANSGRRMLILR